MAARLSARGHRHDPRIPTESTPKEWRLLGEARGFYAGPESDVMNDPVWIGHQIGVKRAVTVAFQISQSAILKLGFDLTPCEP